MIVGPINSGAATGGAGVATSTGTSANIITGVILSVFVKYNDSPPAATTDVTVRTKGTSPRPPSRNILVITNAATDGVWNPRDTEHTTAAADSGSKVLIPVEDYIQVVIAGANDNDNVDVWLELI